MSTIPTELSDEFWKVCDDQGNCHCDWRLTIYGCYEEEHMRPLYIALAAVSALVGLGATALVYHRVIYLNQHIFGFRGKIPRPKPVESMSAFGAVFNLLRMVHAIILITDVAPNVIFRSFLFEFPWQFGIGALACYLFGIAHTLADSSRILYKSWVRTPIIVDCMGALIIVLPFVTNNICSIAAGVFAHQGKNELAAQFTAALYYFWTFYTGFLALLILVAGIRLLRLLRNHLIERSESRVNVGKIKLGALKIKIIVFAGVGCLSIFVVIMFLYGRLRDPIIRNTSYNVAMAAMWMFDGAITTAVIEFGVVLNPRLATLATSFGSSNDKTSTTSELQNSNNQVEDLPPTTCNFGRGSMTVNTTSNSDSKSRFFASDEFTVVGTDPLRSKIEEEQVRYNALTSFARAPSRNVSPIADNIQTLFRPGTIDTSDISTTSSTTFSTVYGR